MRWLILLLFPVIASAAIHSGPAPSTTDQLPPIADGTLLGNTSGSTAAPSALSAIPGGIALPALSNVGSSLYPIYQNQAGATINATSGSSTLTCVTGCSGFYNGAIVFSATAFPSNAIVTDVSGSPSIIVSVTASASATAEVMSIGYNRFDVTSAVLANTLASKSVLAGLASRNNSSWIDAYDPTYCTSTTSLCSLGIKSVNALLGLRSSDNTGASSVGSINTTILSLNDNTGTDHQLWGLYLQTEALLNAGLTHITFGSENDIANQNTAVQANPYGWNVLKGTVAQRLGCGAGAASQTVCMTAMDVVNNGQSFETGINFGNTSLDTSILTHPPAIAMSGGTNGQAVTWYDRTGYSTPSWQEYSTNTSSNVDFISLNDSAWVVGGTGRNWASIGSAATTFGNTTDNPSYTFAGSGAMLFNGGGSATFSALIGTNINVTGSTIPTTGIYRPSSSVLGIACNSKQCANFDSFGNMQAQFGVVTAGTTFTTTGCSVSATTGGATGGTFTLGANNCTVVVTMAGATGTTAPHGWTCQAHDRTAIATVVDGESSSTTTTASFVIPVTAGTTDVISFSCTGY